MNIGRQPHLGNQSDPTSGNTGAIGLFGGELKMRRFDRAAYLFVQFRKKLGNDVIPGESLPVLGFEKLFLNYALGIDKEKSGTRHTLELPDRFCVQNVIGANGLRFGVGEERKFDVPPASEVFQDFLAVVADGRDFDSLFLKSCFRALQLDQLPFAVRSPVGRTKEKENCAFGPFQCGQILLAAKLIAS